MTHGREDALEAAQIVLGGGAVYTRTSGDPFFFSSGWASPVFIDIKKLVSLPEARGRLLDLALRRIDEEFGAGEFVQIAGCELAGVPFASMVAERRALPLIIALKQAKGFGRLAQCEGDFEPGTPTLLFDDLSTDGRTKATFRAALERAEASIAGIFVLLHYNVFPSSSRIVSLMTLADIVAVAERDGLLDPGALEEVKRFAEDAPLWSRRNGGIAKL